MNLKALFDAAVHLSMLRDSALHKILSLHAMLATRSRLMQVPIQRDLKTPSPRLQT
jgi:hypothetical protein